MILSKMQGITVNRIDGGAYFYTCKYGADWYEFRNKLLPYKPVIVVDSATKVIEMMYNGSDPTKVGLSNKSLDVYQLDSFPAESFSDFLKKSYMFVNEEVVEVTQTTDTTSRTKEDIMADLLRLQAELSVLK